MKLNKIITLLFLPLILYTYIPSRAQSYFSYALPPENTYPLPPSRLGDKLVLYVHAKWLSYKYGLPLLYKPFEYSDKLMLSKLEIPLEKGTYNQSALLLKGQNINYKNIDNMLFEVSYLPQGKDVHSEIDYQDKKFKEELKKNLAPILKLETVKPPKDCISIAIQVRKNSGGFDFPLSYEVIEKLGYLPEGNYTDLMFPLKHPTDDYYIEQIKKTLEYFGNTNFYIFLFTDDPNPKVIAEKYQKSLSTYKNVIFDYRKTENKHTLNVLEDLFSMTNFDVLIRAASNLSFIASLIGNFKLKISPAGFKRIGNKIIIDKVNIETDLNDK